ncbi:hypothetical protein QBC33DRAFT_590975 [Phialemonium atrogriseum]|uniref:Bacteriophage T5 Orf172 DNA-binding domain-containing protein n=1 Tax=Phialemonium atrogriseum TaxID=1093897 RepID=A0AAJ0BYI4_9PEZI|nr:uncharacterized protein QBC33DRAFT_590975 [Phialemonium atrogriseum]KAK1765454.1 hypothetical protein QBC33DRAFT_590975 [Phialemonium atrogriseum]
MAKRGGAGSLVVVTEVVTLLAGWNLCWLCVISSMQDPDLREFLSIKKTCLGLQFQKRECQRVLNKSSRRHIENHTARLLGAGFPSDTADLCLWHLAVHSICGIERHDFVVSHDGVRQTLHAHLYNKWHKLLWAEYLKANGILLQRAPPPLHCPGDWKSALPPQRGLETVQRNARPSHNGEVEPVRPGPPKRSWTFTSADSRMSIFLKRVLPLQRESKPHRPGLERRDEDFHITTLDSLPSDKPRRWGTAQDDGRNDKSSPDDLRSNLNDEASAGMAQLASTPFRRPKEGDHDDIFIDQGHAANELERTPLSVGSSLAATVFTPTGRSRDATPLSEVSSNSSDQPQRRLGASETGSPLQRKQARKQLAARDQAYKTDPEPAHFNGVVLYCGPDEDLQKFIRKLSSKTQVDFMFADAGDDAGSAQGTVQAHDFFRLSMSAREALEALLDKLEKPIYHNSSRGGCYIYGYTLPGTAGYIKIGVSVDEQKRLQAWASCCEQTPIKVFKAYMPYAAGLVEKMVHYHLHEFRRQFVCGSDEVQSLFAFDFRRPATALLAERMG